MNNIDYVKMGQKIRLCRKKMGLTQVELAAHAGVSAAFVGHIERGSRVASLDTLVAISRVLDVSADYLLGLSVIAQSRFLGQDLTVEQREAATGMLDILKDTIWRL